jgi:hypothetical protein
MTKFQLDLDTDNNETIDWDGDWLQIELTKAHAVEMAKWIRAAVKHSNFIELGGDVSTQRVCLLDWWHGPEGAVDDSDWGFQLTGEAAKEIARGILVSAKKGAEPTIEFHANRSTSEVRITDD